MDTQTLLNITFGIIGAGAGFILKNIYQSVVDLQKADIELAKKVTNIEVLVVGDYVKRTEYSTKFSELQDALFRKLDRMEDKIDHMDDKINLKEDRKNV